MGFDTAAGSRGPRSRGGSGFAKFVQRLMMKQHRRSWSFAGMDLLFLTTTGRKTGQRHTTPLSWFPADDGGWLIVASAGGSVDNPAWYRNLAANPADAEVEMKGRKVAVTAEQLDDADRDKAWERITAAQPRYTKYQTKTDRNIPIIKLTPVAS